MRRTLAALATSLLAAAALSHPGATTEASLQEVPTVPGAIVLDQVDGARAQAEQAQQVADENLGLAEQRLVDAEAEVAALAAERRTVVGDLARARRQLGQLSVAAYTAAGADSLERDDEVRALAQQGSRPTDPELVAIALTEARAEVERLGTHRERLDDEAGLADAAVDEAEALVQLAQAGVERAAAQVEGVEEAAAALAAGAPVGLTGFRFPVLAAHRYIDSWGFARSGGRTHQGTDVFAAHGSPVVAVEPGHVERIGSNGLGGLVLWLVGASGTEYYYAHLSRFADVADGQEVEAGTPLGYVGETGNAAGTGAHLHFEVHPGGGPATNPYPVLSTATLTADQPRLPGG